MKKRLLTMFLSVTMAFSLVSVHATGAAATLTNTPKIDVTFQDIPNHWAQLPMKWAVENGVLTGTSPTTLSPDETVTRAMAATVLYRYAGSPSVDGAADFSDVPANAYYADAVTWAARTGLTSGKTATTFCPEDAIARQDFAVLLYHLCANRHGLPDTVGKNNVTKPDDFTDVSAVSTYAKDAIDWAVGDLFLSGETKGTECRFLMPQDAITRAEMIHLLRQYDCLIEGHPARLYQFQAETLTSIHIRQGNGTLYQLTDPAEMQRFVEKINAFTYTAQNNPKPAGGFYYYADFFLKQGGFVRLELSPNGIDNHTTARSSDTPYFPQEWFQSFAPQA